MKNYLKKQVAKLHKRVKKIYSLEKQDLKIYFFESDKIAYYKRASEISLNFNKNILKLKKKHIKNIIIHEFAHYVVDHIHDFRARPHGKEWRSVMRALGAKEISATTTVMSTIQKNSNNVKCYCKCQERYISKNRATRIKNGTKYICRDCKTKLKLS